MKNSCTLTAVSDIVSLILGLSTDSWAVVKPHRKGECLDTGGESEDSDCENGSELANEPAPEERADQKKGPELESLPVLIAGSFVKYVQHTLVAEREFLTLPIAGGLCSSICARK